MEWYLEKLTPQEYELIQNYRAADAFRRYRLENLAKVSARKQKKEGE